MVLFHTRAFLASTGIAIALMAQPAMAFDGKPAVDKDTIVMALSKEIGNLDAQVTASGDSQRYGWQMFDTLYALNEAGDLVPSLATDLKISGESGAPGSPLSF